MSVAPLFSLFLQGLQLGYIAKGKLCPNSPMSSKQEIDLKSFWFDTGTIGQHSLTTVVRVHPLCHELLLKYIVKKYIVIIILIKIDKYITLIG